MARNAQKNLILEIPLTDVMRMEIAVPLQQILHLYTVGDFLHAWANPQNHESIEPIFEHPAQAHHAATVCAGWLGVRSSYVPIPMPVVEWWRNDEIVRAAA